MKSIKPHKWLDLIETSCMQIDYVERKYSRVNWYVDGRDSWIDKFFLDRDDKKQERVLKLFRGGCRYLEVYI